MATLLVIDDEESLLYSLESGLAEDGLTVRTAATGQDGVDAVRNQAPEAVVLDMRLPDMTGLDVFDRIRRIDPHLPVILLTAFATTETAIEAMKRGAFEYLLKPIDLHRLRDVVRRRVRCPSHAARAGRTGGRAGAGPRRRNRRPQPQNAGRVQIDRPHRLAGCERPGSR